MKGLPMGTPRRRRQYGTGSIIRRTDGRWIGSIEAGWTERGTRRRIYVSAKTEAECKRRLRDRHLEIDRAGTTTATSRATVKSYADEWSALTVNQLRPGAYTANVSALRKWIVPTIGHRRLTALTPADVRAVQTAQRDAGRAVSTIVRTHTVLIAMLKAAQQDGHNITANVLATRGPDRDKITSDRAAFPVEDALRVLQVAATLPHGSRYAVAFLQGMRQGECLGLTWDEVDLERGLVAVSWQLQALPYADRKQGTFRVPDGYEARQLHRSAHLVRPKSRRGWRIIPLAPWVLSALDAWRAIAPENPHGLVWPRADGLPQSKHDDLEEWQALQTTAEVGHPSGRFYVPHEARHTTATLLMELGVDQAVITAIMGHSSITTSRGYMHVSTETARRAMEGVAERLALPA